MKTEINVDIEQNLAYGNLCFCLRHTMECSCKICKDACKKRPGWFLPGEVAKAATAAGMSEQDFFNKFVSVDFYTFPDGHVFVLAPAINRSPAGTEYPFDPHGQCVFFIDEKCAIHSAKPNECLMWDHTKEFSDSSHHRNTVIVEAWKNNQEEIERLLGRKPEAPVPNVLDVLGMMTSFLSNHSDYRNPHE